MYPSLHMHMYITCYMRGAHVTTDTQHVGKQGNITTLTPVEPTLRCTVNPATPLELTLDSETRIYSHTHT